MVDILMATYNGEKYISKQIDSILDQTYTNWNLYINDDCSTDSTFEIIKDYAVKYPEKIFVSQSKKNTGSAGANFFSMIEKSTGDIIMTCDQDDIWLEDKVERTVLALEGQLKPTLFHTDLKVIDENDNILYESMIDSQHININRTSTNRLIVQNIVTGCTMAINRALADIIITPKNQPVHDWYIAVIASLFGQIKYSDKPSILYRKHSLNAVGPVDMDSSEYIANRFKDKSKAKHMLELGYDMADEIIDLYNTDNKLLKEYSKMKEYSKLKKLKTVFKYKIWKSGIVRKIGQIYFM